MKLCEVAYFETCAFLLLLVYKLKCNSKGFALRTCAKIIVQKIEITESLSSVFHCLDAV